MHHRSLNVIARGRIPNQMQHGHQPPYSYVIAFTMELGPLYADRGRLLRCALDLDRGLPTTCALDPVKTAMEKRRARERERYRRQTAFTAYRTQYLWKKFLLCPLPDVTSNMQACS